MIVMPSWPALFRAGRGFGVRLLDVGERAPFLPIVLWTCLSS